MYDFLLSNPIYAVIFLVLVLITMVYLLVKYAQNVGLEKIRAIVYQGFLDAEHAFKHGDNKQKFDYVVQLARSSLPKPFNIFITESLLRKTIQLWFDLCKDLLDDGKFNNSEK
jgi:hypothetical protein